MQTYYFLSSTLELFGLFKAEPPQFKAATSNYSFGRSLMRSLNFFRIVVSGISSATFSPVNANNDRQSL